MELKSDHEMLLTLIGLVGAAEDRAARLQLGVHGNVLSLESVYFIFAFIEYLFHVQVALLLASQQLLHGLPLIVHLGKQRITFAICKCR